MTRAAVILMLCALVGCTDRRQSSVTENAGVSLELERSLQAHTAQANQVQFSPDSRILASAGVDSVVKVWDPASGSLLRALKHPVGVTSLAFSGDGALLVTGSYDGNVRVWRVVDGRLLTTLAGHAGTVWTVAFSRDGLRVASGGEDKTIRVWRVADGTTLATLRGHTLNVWSVRFSPDDKLLASGSFDRSVRLWDVESGRLIHTFSEPEQAVVVVALSPDGQTLAAGGDDEKIRFWRLEDNSLLRTIDAGNHVWSLSFSGDGKWLASSGRARGALGTLWHQLAGNRFSASAVSVRLWHVADGSLAAALSRHSDDAPSVSISPGGNRIATSSLDGSVDIWRVSFGASNAGSSRD
jgi:WD40 repeat protein